MPKSASKMKNMTDEERVLFMEQKMLLEVEAKKKKEDLINELLKEKLKKEEKNTRHNLNKINYQWRSIMRDAKAKELLKDIEIMSQTFERIIDRKDTVIRSLVKDLQEADEQYAMAMRSHFQNVDELIELHKEQLDAARLKCENLVAEIKIEFDKERQYILARHETEMNELTSVIFAMEKSFLDQENEANIEFLSQRDETRNRNMEEKQQLRVNLEFKINETFDQFKQTMKNYSEMNEDRERQFTELKEKDEKSAKEIDMQMRKIQTLTDNINSLKAKLALNTKESLETNNSIKENRDTMNAHHHELKSQMKLMQDTMRKKLTVLSKQSSKSIECLTKQQEKAGQILRFAEMCRVLETEEEKILPFYASSLTEQEEEDLREALLETNEQGLAEVGFHLLFFLSLLGLNADD